MAFLISGLVWTLALNGLVGAGAYLVAARALGLPRGLPRVLASCLLGWSWITLGMQLIGPFGGLARWPMLGWSAAGLIIGLASRYGRRNPEPAEPPIDADRDWTWEATAALLLALWPVTLMAVRSLVLPVKVMSDGPIYHLWFAARWWQEGRLFLVAAPFGESVVTYFPCNGDLWFAWLMIGWGSETLAKVGQLPFLGLAALALHGTALRLGAGRTASVIAACWVSTVTALLIFSVEANVDTIFVAGYLLSVSFFIRFALGDGDLVALGLAALAAGDCWGTKPSGLVFLPPTLAVFGAAAMIRQGSIKRRIARLSLLVLGTLVPIVYWYGGNTFRSGNPLYPLQVDVLGRTVLTGWHDASVMRMSPYFIDRSDLDAFFDLLMQVFDPRLVPLWLGGLVVGGLVGARRRLMALLAFLALLNLAIYWFAIPYRTQQRFMFHAVAVAALPLAVLLDRSRFLRVLAVALLALHVLTPMTWPWASSNGPEGQEAIPWDRSDLIPNALPPLVVFSPPGASAGTRGSWPLSANATTALAGVLSVLAAWTIGAAVRRPSAARTARAALAFGALFLVTGLAAFPWGSRPADRFFAPFPDYYGGWRALDRVVGPGGSRIAYAGTNLPYFLLGPGLKNQVAHVNVDRHPDWLMHDYHRRAVARGQPNWPDPRPGWDRAEPNVDAWLENLRAEEMRWLVVARHNVGEAWPIERRWADERPDLFPRVYGDREKDPLFRIYAVQSSGHEKGQDRTEVGPSGH